MKKLIPAATIALGVIVFIIPEDDTLIIYDCDTIDHIKNVPDEVVTECHKLMLQEQQKVISL